MSLCICRLWKHVVSNHCLGRTCRFHYQGTSDVLVSCMSGRSLELGPQMGLLHRRLLLDMQNWWNGETRSIRCRYSYGIRAGCPRCRRSTPGRYKIFSSPRRPTKRLIQWLLGTLSWVVKRSKREADHSTPTNAEVERTRISTSAPHTSSLYST
jgi:hypothetical protein